MTSNVSTEIETISLVKDVVPKKPNDGFRNPVIKGMVPKVIPSPVKVLTSNLGRSRAPSLQWERSEWDLAECGRILDTEGYVRRAFKNKRNLFLKEGYEFVGSKPERVTYIKRRLRQMEQATGLPFRILMAATASCLIRTHNAFWVKVRKTAASGGRVRTLPNNKKLKPIAGYFLMAPETVRFKRDEFGKLKKYAQEIYGKTRVEFNPEDVVHFYFDKREGYSVGTPILAPVKDDIRALRRIEENVELLVYQHLFPLFQYKVGTEKNPADILPSGITEVEHIQMMTASMPADGCWVTPERHEITPLNVKGGPVAVEKIIAHFKQRIFTGLGQSSVDMGEGDTSNNSTAQTMSRNLVDDTKADQNEFAEFIESYVIQELLFESTFSDATVLDDENEVKLKFKEIDNEARQAKENHYVDIWTKNAITHDEMRMEMGHEPFDGDGWPTSSSRSKMFTEGDGDWAGTNYGLIERDKIILQSLDEPGTDASKSESKSRTKATTTKAAGGNSVSNKNKPANQHGTRSSAKVNKDSFGDRNTIPSLDMIYSQQAPLQRMYDMLAQDVDIQIRTRGTSIKELKLLVDLAFSMAKDKLVLMAKRSYRLGLQDMNVQPWHVRTDLADAKIHDHIDRYIVKLKDNLINNLDRQTIKTPGLKAEDAILAGIVFKALRHRAAMIDNSEVMRAYNYGRASGWRINGFNEIVSRRRGSESCDICDTYALKYKNTDDIIYEELPPLHPHCTCTMELSE